MSDTVTITITYPAPGTPRDMDAVTSVLIGTSIVPPPRLAALALSHSFARKCFIDASRKERKRPFDGSTAPR